MDIGSSVTCGLFEDILNRRRTVLKFRNRVQGLGGSPRSHCEDAEDLQAVRLTALVLSLVCLALALVATLRRLSRPRV